MKSSLEIAKICLEIAREKKAQEIVLLDLRELSYVTDFFVITSGKSSVHSKAIALSIEEKMKTLKILPRGVEGLKEGSWILLDYEDVVVHIFQDEERRFYNLEKLWADAKEVSFEDV